MTSVISINRIALGLVSSVCHFDRWTDKAREALMLRCEPKKGGVEGVVASVDHKSIVRVPAAGAGH